MKRDRLYVTTTFVCPECGKIHDVNYDWDNNSMICKCGTIYKVHDEIDCFDNSYVNYEYHTLEFSKVDHVVGNPIKDKGYRKHPILNAVLSWFSSYLTEIIGTLIITVIVALNIIAVITMSPVFMFLAPIDLVIFVILLMFGVCALS